MKATFAVRIPAGFTDTVGRFRTSPGLQVGRDEKSLWLCGATVNAELEMVIKSLPRAEFFRILNDGQLVAAGKLVPDGHLPELKWEPVDKAIIPEVPSAAFCGRLETRASIVLIDSCVERDANVLVTPFEIFRQWALPAPEIRLRPLRFAVNNREEHLALVCGSPLPPIQGIRYCEEAGIATLVGTSWSPALSATQLATFWNLEEGDLCLWNRQGKVLIRGDQFVAGTRSSLAATHRSIGGETK